MRAFVVQDKYLFMLICFMFKMLQDYLIPPIVKICEDPLTLCWLSVLRALTIPGVHTQPWHWNCETHLEARSVPHITNHYCTQFVVRASALFLLPHHEQSCTIRVMKRGVSVLHPFSSTFTQWWWWRYSPLTFVLILIIEAYFACECHDLLG